MAAFAAGHSGFFNETKIRRNDMKCIDKTDPSNPIKCENYWIDTLKTHYSHGLLILIYTISETFYKSLTYLRKM